MVAYALLIVSLIAAPVLAGDIVIGQWGGLNTEDNPATLDASQAQDLLNVDIIGRGGGISKREGYSTYKSLPINTSTTSVHGGHHFQDSSGNDIQLWGNDIELVSIVGGAAPVKVATGTVSATWQCADSQGSAYCFNSARDAPVKTDGTAGGTSYTNIPKGTMGAFTPDRLIVSGVSGAANTLYLSEANVFTNFTTGVTETSPWAEVIASPGSRITHVRYACDKIMWFKDQSFGWMIGTTQFDTQVGIVQPDIGTLDNSSAYYNGHLYFRGQDNHVYDYDCSNITRLSTQIKPTVSGSSRRKANSWTQTSNSDFSAGYTSSTIVFNGGVHLSTSNTNILVNDSFESIGIEHSPYGYQPSGWTLDLANPTTGNFALGTATAFNSKPALDGTYFGRFTGVAGLASATTSQAWTVSIVNVDVSSSVVSSVSISTSNLLTWTTYTLSLDGVTLGNYYKVMIRWTNPTNTYNSSSLDQRIYSSSAAIQNEISFRVYISTDVVFAKVAHFDMFTGGNPGSYLGYYRSAVYNAPNLTSWNVFSASIDNGGGTVGFLARSSTNSFTVASSTPSWGNITLGVAPAISTGTYFQLWSSFTISRATQTMNLNDFTFNWFEGVAADKSYMEYFDDHLWVSVSSGTSGLNNRVLRWDVPNSAWLVDDIAANGFLVDQNRLFFGSPSVGAVYEFGEVDSDAGSDINAFWKSKDFVGDDPFVQNELKSQDWLVRGSTGSLTVTYQTDASSSTSYSINLYSDTAGLLRRSSYVTPGKIGNFCNIKFGDTSSYQAWEVFGHRSRYVPLPWRPQ